MAAFQFPKGVAVRQIVTVVRGRVSDYQVDKVTGERVIGVEWYDATNQHHERYFQETEIELDLPPVVVVPKGDKV
jgi:hypothetical protein